MCRMRLSFHHFEPSNSALLCPKEAFMCSHILFKVCAVSLRTSFAATALLEPATFLVCSRKFIFGSDGCGTVYPANSVFGCCAATCLSAFPNVCPSFKNTKVLEVSESTAVSESFVPGMALLLRICMCMCLCTYCALYDNDLLTSYSFVTVEVSLRKGDLVVSLYLSLSFFLSLLPT